MATNPITEVRLLNVPLDNEYLHTIYFEDAGTQEEIFKRKTVGGGILENYTFQRKDNIIRCGIHYDDLVSSGCNYVMYKNNYKWYYAFITKLEYVNEGTTNIHIETDVMQTWLEEMIINPCFVEREHVEDDTFGLHTVPEGLETGEYTVHNLSIDDTFKDIVYVLGTTLTVGELADAQGGLVDGIYSSLNYTVFSNTKEGIERLNSTIKMFQDGHAEAIKILFTAPKNIVGGSDGWYWNLKTEEESKKPYYTVFQPETTEYFNGYKPHNNKLLTFPYRYLVVSNNNGNNAIYQFELFTNPDKPQQFKTVASLTPGCSIRLFPLNYKNVSQNNEEGINGGKYPITNWTSDVYTNWLTQNSVNIGVGVAGSALTIIGGVAAIATGAGAVAGASMIASGVVGVAGSMGQVYQHSFTPPQAEGNINSGDVVTASGFNCFYYYTTGIKREFAEKLDSYFDCYGYKINQVKTPAKAHRKWYWYTKTIDANITGKIPTQELRKIKECYNKGITFWNDISVVGNYNLGSVNHIVERS